MTGDTLQAVRAITEPGGVQKTAAKSYLLSGILLCGKCGHKMTANSGRYWCGSVHNGLCSVTISPHLIENKIISHVLIQAWAYAQQKIAEQDTKQRAAVELALAKIRDERQQVAQAGLSLASRLAEYKALDERERDLQEQAKAQVQQSVLGSLVADLVPLGLASGALPQLAALETLQSRWEALDFQQQRLLLQSFDGVPLLSVDSMDADERVLLEVCCGHACPSRRVQSTGSGSDVAVSKYRRPARRDTRSEQVQFSGGPLARRSAALTHLCRPLGPPATQPLLPFLHPPIECAAS